MINPNNYPYDNWYPASRNVQNEKFNYFPSKYDEEEYCDYFDLGDMAPDFTLKGIINGRPEEVTLSDYRGKWVVVFFYSSDFTFV